MAARLTKNTTSTPAARRRMPTALSAREVFAERAMLAAMLRGDDFSFYAIRQVLKCASTEEARRLVARGNRIWRTPV